MSSVYGIYQPGANNGSVIDRTPVQTLGQDDFLKLLVTQMTSQDPMNPKQDTDFIAQMAQFSALEQSKVMQSDMAQMRSDQQIMQAYGLLGQTIEVQVDDKTTAQGMVSAVQMEAGTPKLVVGDKEYTLDQVILVYPTPVPTETES
jgi:flagellar basal-body rod modification protein FlgD